MEGEIEQRLSVSLKKVLREQGILDGKIRYVVPTDMNTGGEYADGYVIVTEKRLIAALQPPDKTKVQIFKGYRKQVQAEDMHWAYRSLPLNEIEEIHVEDCIGCNLLVVKAAEEEHTWAVFSNFHKRRMTYLARNLGEYLHSGTFRAEEVETEEYCPKCGRMYPNPHNKLCPHCVSHKSVFYRIIGYFRPYRMKMAVMMLCILASAALNLVWPYLNGTILYDYVLKKDDAFLEKVGINDGKYLVALFLVVLAMFLSKLVLLGAQIIQGIVSAQMVINVVRDMKKDIFRKMGELSISFYRNRQTGNLMTRVMSDADRVTGFFVDDAPYILVHVSTVVCSVIVMLLINWQMALLAVALFPFLLIFNILLRPRIWVAFGKRHRAESSLNHCVHDSLSGARVVKAFGQEEEEIERFFKCSNRLRRTEEVISYWQNFFHLFFNGAQELALVGVWGLGAILILRGAEGMNLGTLITFAGYVGQLQGPMRAFSQISQKWADSMNSAERMFEIMDAVPEVQEPSQSISLPVPKGELTLRHVTFGYEVNRAVLKDINLHIPAGSVIGIVGKSGVGKSTLVNLISRMYDTQEGVILLDGVDIKRLSFGELRRNVALVSQETFVFQGTIAENIAYSNPEAPLQDIINAAKLAGAHEFIMRMQDGYETMIGASGKGLSGGEKQRISIARAILANPRILILDEATASVDTETERLIQHSLNYLVQGRTTISIAHRLSTLREADYLFVVDNGRIAEQGTYEELVKKHGIFYKLLELQEKALAMKGLED